MCICVCVYISLPHKHANVNLCTGLYIHPRNSDLPDEVSVFRCTTNSKAWGWSGVPPKKRKRIFLADVDHFICCGGLAHLQFPTEKT